MGDKTTIGYEYESGSTAPIIGSDATIRPGTVVYNDVVIGDRFSTGHSVVIREFTEIGDDVLVGTNTTIDGRTQIGSNANLQTGVYVPSETIIGDDVFLGPRAVLTNDLYPLRQDAELEGPTLEDDVSIGANATILPGVTIGQRSFVAAGALVTKDVPQNSLAIGSPATHEPLPEQLQRGNVYS